MHKYKLFFFLLVTFLLSTCGGKEQDEIKVGVILPLTGAVAEPGNKALKGINLAIDNYNSRLTRNKIDLFVEDTLTDPKSGVSAINKLIKVDGVKVILGDLMSSVAMAIAPIAEKNVVVLLAPGASNPKFTKMGKYVFRNWASDNYDGIAMADYLSQRLKFSKGAIIYVQNDYGFGLAEAFKRHFTMLGGSIDAYESYLQGTTDFRAITTKIKFQEGIQFIYLPGQPQENGRLVKQLIETGVNCKFVANLSVESPDFLNIVGKKAEGIIFSSPAFEPDMIISNKKTFQSLYQAKYNSLPDVVAGHGFDAARILIQALETCRFDLSELRYTIASIKNFPGVTGKTTFTSDGDVIKDVFIKKIDESGNIILLERFKLND